MWIKLAFQKNKWIKLDFGQMLPASYYADEA
jgi:hypothetical protein